MKECSDRFENSRIISPIVPKPNILSSLCSFLNFVDIFLRCKDRYHVVSQDVIFFFFKFSNFRNFQNLTLHFEHEGVLRSLRKFADY